MQQQELWTAILLNSSYSTLVLSQIRNLKKSWAVYGAAVTPPGSLALLGADHGVNAAAAGGGGELLQDCFHCGAFETIFKQDDFKSMNIFYTKIES